MERRKEDPVIVSIHDRLDRLEDISDDLREIKEWIATVVKVTRMFEIAGNFAAKWAILFGKIAAGTAIGWAAFKYGAESTFSKLREFLIK